MAELIAPVADRLGELDQLCRRHRVQRLDLFGSATTGRYRREGSDLDFLVEFQPTETPGARANAYFGTCWKALKSSSNVPSTSWSPQRSGTPISWSR